MTTFALILGLSLGACLGLTPLVRALATRYGFVDRPDGRRKIHARATPVVGGLALLLSCSAALAVALVVPTVLRDHLVAQRGGLLGLLLAAAVICAVGLADDYFGLRGMHKLLGQLAAVAVVMHYGLMIRTIRLFDWQLELGPLAAPFTAFWLLGAINSLNLIDGMDGLLSSVGLIISLALAVMAGLAGQWAAACVAVALAGGLIGFLWYNFPPASIFLGDCGSMLVGLVVGVLAIHGSLKGAATIALAAPLAVLTIPIFDTAAAITRRKLTGRSIYTTDRGHLHHCLLRRGLSSRRVLLLVSCSCVVTVTGALASLALGNELFALITALAVVGILVAARLFGYVEFLLVKQHLGALVASLWRRPAVGQARQRQVRLQGSADWGELWGRLTARARQLNLKTVRLDVNAPALYESYHARWDLPGDGTRPTGLWHADIPLVAGRQAVGRLEITGQRDHESVGMKITILCELVEQWEAAVAALAAGEAAPAEPAPAGSPPWRDGGGRAAPCTNGVSSNGQPHPAGTNGAPPNGQPTPGTNGAPPNGQPYPSTVRHPA